MPGYLDQYGAGVERRLKIIKTVVISVASIVLAAAVLTFVFYNYRQEQQVKRFFEKLASRDYPGAYALWVRTEQDRRGYPMEAFLRDWGPGSEHADISGYRIAKSLSCGTGVMMMVDFGKGAGEKLWVQRADLAIGFSPPSVKIMRNLVGIEKCSAGM
jgi:hypothetical protein